MLISDIKYGYAIQVDVSDGYLENSDITNIFGLTYRQFELLTLLLKRFMKPYHTDICSFGLIPQDKYQEESESVYFWLNSILSCGVNKEVLGELDILKGVKIDILSGDILFNILSDKFKLTNDWLFTRCVESITPYHIHSVVVNNLEEY